MMYNITKDDLNKVVGDAIRDCRKAHNVSDPGWESLSFRKRITGHIWAWLERREKESSDNLG